MESTADAELDRLVRELLRTVPASTENRVPASFALLSPARHQARASSSSSVLGRDPNFDREVYPSEIDLEPAIGVIAKRAQTLTGATGAPLRCVTATKLSVPPVPVEPRPTWGFACRPTPAFLPTVFAPARWSFATMQTEIRPLTLPAAGAWACARSSLLPCAISVGHWAFSRSFRPLLMP